MYIYIYIFKWVSAYDLKFIVYILIILYTYTQHMFRIWYLFQDILKSLEEEFKFETHVEHKYTKQ